MTNSDTVSVLELALHGATVGFLAGYRDGRTTLTFAPEFASDEARPTFSLITHPAFPKAEAIMEKPWVKRQKLHPVLSNLLPEGALREYLAQALKTHADNEFELFAYLGQDLPGALIATAIEPDAVPDYVLDDTAKASAVKSVVQDEKKRFSLAGVQMKFSMRESDGRYQIAESGGLGDWIIKTPSTTHKHVPLNEYTAMHLAELAGVTIPDIRLVEMDKLEQLPAINLPNEHYAFAIRRFDRHEGERIHMEDFAQILVKYPQEKYRSANYQNIGKILYAYAEDGLGDVQQFARRLLVNILLANGDAHLKNWSVLYPDKVTPTLSPAYDIVTTRVYMGDEREFALNLGKSKDWYQASMAQFEYWAGKADIPWRAIRPHLLDTIDKARSLWPEALQDLPMDEKHKVELKEHWRDLHPDFRIDAP
ncbi:type II toxin-antitoxin system HipA family toxin [Kineobactrum salinum]|uniref:Type II toxin-antitoxin system HipA family toxin n=1 Tax=Kineobactrum salinum TaxID=2708301 RepID=A0A6C0U231_9GAMM|nr:type II toxin-antitoxin system HipA family toxin [Kineobactrum salinum]QIB66121.1 type II toxin-antitoxin system HipA family toxin [Kineobactrum salinum]